MNTSGRFMKWTDIPRGKYGSIHNWLHKNYPKNSKCELCGDTEKRHEWALKRGKKYERRIENFMELCVRCHRTYDDSIRQAQRARRRVVLAFNDFKVLEFESVADASRSLGISPTTITNNLSGRAMISSGFRWAYVSD